MIVVLLLASGGPWEPAALRMLGERSDVVVLKRCVDLPDLLASATSGQAQVAVLDADTPGLDVAAVDHLQRHGVRPVAVCARAGLDGARVQLRRIGVAAVVGDDDLSALPDVVARAVVDTREAAPLPGPPAQPPPAARGRVSAVWGPAGAPGRSLVAAAVAAELARRRHPTVLVDADPYGGTLGQALGVTDEVSGVLAASRWAVSGQLPERLGSVQRGLGPCLSVVTGIPRPERWSEVRAEALEELVDLLRRESDVVLDTGFGLDDDPSGQPGGRPGRDRITLAALEVADEVVVVGAADPVGLSRLARGVVDVRDVLPSTPLRVVVNRMRPSLGWSPDDIARMLGGFVRLESLHFLPDDRVGVDRALVAGRSLLEGGESDLTRAVAGLVDAWAPSLRPRRAGRVRRR